MTEPAPSVPRLRWPGVVIFIAATGALLAAAALVMFSAFMPYDDEGYVLLSLKNFVEHGQPYRELHSQYGPFPFVLHQLLHALGLPLTHTGGRLLTLALWAGAAVLCALHAGRVTRSGALRLAVLAAAFAYLWVMANEPSHPGGVIVFLTTAAATLGHRWLSADHMRTWAVATGAIVAAMALSNINVGVFLAFSTCAWALLHHRSTRVHQLAPAGLTLICVLLPLLLMRPLLSEEWVRSFALVWACAAMAVVRVLGINSEGRADWGMLGWAILGLVLAGGSIVGVALVRGSSLTDLWHGIVLAPLRPPTALSLHYVWPPGIRIVMLASLALCLLALAGRGRRRRTIDTGIALGRLLATAAFAFNLGRFPDISPDYLTFGFTLPFLWLFVWPLSGEAPEASQARGWLALVLLGQVLHAFPVPGSQLVWGSILAIPLAAAGAWDAAVWLRTRYAGQGPLPGVRWIASAGIASVAIFAIAMGWKLHQAGSRHRDGRHLGLPGAEALRLPAHSVALLRLLTLNATAHADVLFSEPGMFSFNLWSGKPPPTLANVTHWFSLLNPAQQGAIIDKLRAAPRACVIVDHGHERLLAKRGIAPAGPLHDFIAREFEPAFTIGEFEFRVHRGRVLTPFLVGEILVRDPAASPADAAASGLLHLALPCPPPHPVVRIEITAAPGAVSPLLVLDATNARVEITPLTPRGDPAGPAQPLAWPLRTEGPAALAIYYDHARQPRPAIGATLVLRDAAGEEIGLARLRH